MGHQEEGQAIFDEFLAAFTAADPAVMTDRFLSDAVFWGTHSRDLIVGHEQIRQYFVDAFNRLPGAKATAIGKVLTVKVAEDVLAVSGSWQNERQAEGKAIITSYRNNFVAVKLNGQWKIASFANSPRPQAT